MTRQTIAAVVFHSEEPFRHQCRQHATAFVLRKAEQTPGLFQRRRKAAHFEELTPIAIDQRRIRDLHGPILDRACLELRHG
jgi:hypothetical protein